jgi:hypothetical protein
MWQCPVASCKRLTALKCSLAWRPTPTSTPSSGVYALQRVPAPDAGNASWVSDMLVQGQDSGHQRAAGVHTRYFSTAAISCHRARFRTVQLTILARIETQNSAPDHTCPGPALPPGRYRRVGLSSRLPLARLSLGLSGLVRCPGIWDSSRTNAVHWLDNMPGPGDDRQHVRTGCRSPST